MASYDVWVSVNIMPRPDDTGQMPPGQLTFSRSFRLEGNRFSDIATRVDALVDAVEMVVTIGSEKAGM